MAKEGKYKCSWDDCNASFTRPCRLEVHARKHTGERPFKCDIPGCSVSYTNIAHLKRHTCQVHEKSDEVVCGEKGCGKVFTNKYNLKKHFNRIHKLHENVLICMECSQSFKQKRQLKKHLYIHREQSLKCTICNIAFTKLHLYNKHKRNHKTFTCDCGVVCNRWTEFCEHRRTSCNIKHVDHECVICNKIFKTKSNLKHHSMSHVEESQLDMYRCPYINCRRSYKYNQNLSLHIRTFHEKEERSIQCSEPGCGKVLKSKRILEYHLIKVHRAIRKKKKDRKPRHDKGKPKKCMASVMSGIELPLKEHLTIINDQGAHTSCSWEEKSVQMDGNLKKLSSSGEIKQDSCDGNANNSDISWALYNGLDYEMKVDCISNAINILHEHNGSKDEIKKHETEKSINIQNELENSVDTETEQNINVEDDPLLNYCDGVLQTLQNHMDKLTKSSLVY